MHSDNWLWKERKLCKFKAHLDLLFRSITSGHSICQYSSKWRKMFLVLILVWSFNSCEDRGFPDIEIDSQDKKKKKKNYPRPFLILRNLRSFNMREDVMSHLLNLCHFILHPRVTFWRAKKRLWIIYLAEKNKCHQEQILPLNDIFRLSKGNVSPTSDSSYSL